MFSDVEGEASSEWIGFVDPNEPRYCLCNQVSKCNHANLNLGCRLGRSFEQLSFYTCKPRSTVFL